MNSSFSPFKIALAVSGGKDSMGMLHAVKTWGDVVVLTVDHQLRAESSQETLVVNQWMRDLNIPHVILKWDHELITTDIQNKARNARYDLMTTWCHQNNVPTLMTAHHLEDQLETFFMRLAKGSGLKGLCAMQAETQKNGIYILRPFLWTSKKELHKYIPDQNWIDDPSNTDEKFARVKFRKLVEHYLELDPEINMIKTLFKLNEVNDYLNQVVQESSNKNWIELDYIIFERLINEKFSKNGYPFKTQKLKRLYERLNSDEFKATTFAHHLFMKNKDGKICIQKQ